MARFYYNMADCYTHDDREYWTKETIRKIRVYPATPELDAKAMDLNSTLWPVYDCSGRSSEAVECKDKDEAYKYLLEALNLSIYEGLYDI